VLEAEHISCHRRGVGFDTAYVTYIQDIIVPERPKLFSYAYPPSLQ
jgi:hypothetical protein